MSKSIEKLNIWVGIVGIIISLIGSGISLYTTNFSKQERRPAFFLEGTSPENFIDIKKSGLQITRKNGKIISDRLYFLSFYFWNNGNTSIRKENILKPLTIKVFASRKSKIINVRIVSVSRDVVKPAIIFNPNENAQSVVVNYKILEKNDGFRINLIISSPEGFAVKPLSSIEGASELSTIGGFESFNWPMFFSKYFKYLFLWAIIWVGLTSSSAIIFITLAGKVKSSRIQRLLFKIILYIILLIFPLIYIYQFDSPFKKIQYEAIPNSIKIDEK